MSITQCVRCDTLLVSCKAEYTKTYDFKPIPTE